MQYSGVNQRDVCVVVLMPFYKIKTTVWGKVAQVFHMAVHNSNGILIGNVRREYNNDKVF